jgi:PhzF family phenazine biosynthesis protein
MFFIVDAFSNVAFRGNPAGVMIVEEFLTTQEMQTMAKFLGLPDFAFVKQISTNKFDIRWFSPLDESPICGHGTIAASHIVFSELLPNSDVICFSYRGGNISAIMNSRDEYMISFPRLEMSKCTDFQFEIKDLINIEQCKIIYEDKFTYMIVLSQIEDIFCARINFENVKKIDKRALILTSPGFDDFDFCVRYFAPKVGVYEDPVCGSANCRAAIYWSQEYQKRQLVSFQPSKRTGIVGLTVADNNILIFGKATTVCQLTNLVNITEACQ